MIEIRYSEKDEQYICYGDLHASPIKGALDTPGGEVRIYSRTLERFSYKDCPVHPTQPMPDEQEGTADEKQSQLLTAYPTHRLYSQLNYTELHKRYAVAGRKPTTAHTEDTAHFSTTNGDLVRVRDRCGQIPAGTVTTGEIKGGVMCVHEGA